MSFLLLIIGFIFAAYIYNTRYLVLSRINELILNIERICPEKLFRFEEKMRLFDLEALDVYSDSLISFLKPPYELATYLNINRENILPFLKMENNLDAEYFLVTTNIIHDLLREPDSKKAKEKFVEEFLGSNFRGRDIPACVQTSGGWFLDKEGLVQKRVNLRESISKMDERQLDQIVLTYLSIAKTSLIALIVSIKEKYIDSRFLRAIKKAIIAFLIMVLLQALFYLVWHIDLLHLSYKVLAAIFERND